MVIKLWDFNHFYIKEKEHMQKYKGLPIFIVDINDESVFNNVSIVDMPAIERNFIQLSKQADIKFSVNEEKRTVSGPVLIPDVPIYRKDNGKEYYIKWTADTIKQYAIKFFRDGRESEGNVQHSISFNGITFYESFLLNRDRGIVPKEFADLPDGTWFLSARIDNDKVFELIKDGTLKGFSVEIQTSLSEEDKPIDKLEELMDYLKNNK